MGGSLCNPRVVVCNIYKRDVTPTFDWRPFAFLPLFNNKMWKCLTNIVVIYICPP
jgi:hypothetical protein